MNVENYYEFLEIHPKADSKEIRLAYLTKLKEWHPDKNAHRIEEAEEVTKILNHVYYILNDPQRRKHYDRMLRFTKGKNFDEKINDTAFGEKLEKSSPIFKQILKNLQVCRYFVNSIKMGNGVPFLVDIFKPCHLMMPLYLDI